MKYYTCLGLSIKDPKKFVRKSVQDDKFYRKSILINKPFDNKFIF